MQRKVLVLDDDSEMRKLLCEYIAECGYPCEIAGTAHLAIQRLLEQPFDLLITDLRLGEANGLDVLREAKKIRPGITVIIITAFGSIENAVEAIKEGAYHYITKPFKMAEIFIILSKAIEAADLRQENAGLRQVIDSTYHFENILGRSKAMQEVFDIIHRLLDNTSNILITGESGTGKEMIAKAIHFNSPLKNGPFVAINCSSIPEGLLESELFGHVKGAFTGAVTSQTGLIEEADGGSLFLDEIGDMPLVLQSKLLRVLQDQVVRPVGSRDERKINVRIISATHKNLEEAISNKHFRDDLYYRLNVIPIKLPRLAERREDIPLLARHFIKKHAGKTGKAVVKDITPEAILQLQEYSWPGNVRELENMMERAMAFARSEVLLPEEIPIAVQGKDSDLLDHAFRNNLTLEELENIYIRRVLESTHGQKSIAAKILGINRRTLYRKSERYGIPLKQDSENHDFKESEEDGDI